MIDRAAWRPEHRLLFCVAQGASADVGPLQALFQERLDWPLILRTAQTHALAPLLEWHLNRLEPPHPLPLERVVQCR
jgi:hypothetical protein